MSPLDTALGARDAALLRHDWTAVARQEEVLELLALELRQELKRASNLHETLVVE